MVFPVPLGPVKLSLIHISEPTIFLHSLQKVADLDIGIAVVTVLHFAALTEQCVSLVKEEDRRVSRSFSKDVG